MFDFIKSCIVTIASALIVYLDPVSGSIESLAMLFLLNFAVGYITDIVKFNNNFSMSKFLMCFVWAAVIMVLICSMYFIGERNGNKEETLVVVRYISLIAIWAFGTNILRNLRLLSYGTGVYYDFFNAVYTWFSLEIIKRIPFLTNLNKQDYENKQ